jgi:hypothetical protein
MDDSEAQTGTGGVVIPLSGFRQPERVVFTRIELQQILIVYGRMVARGEWRDYAIEFAKDYASFAVFRRASERPLYRIFKTPKAAARQGAYSVVADAGYVLRRGADLARVLMVLEKPSRV